MLRNEIREMGVIAQHIGLLSLHTVDQVESLTTQMVPKSLPGVIAEQNGRRKFPALLGMMPKPKVK